METEHIEQNIKLSMEFDEYMWADPENRWPLIPQEAEIVFAIEGDDSFNAFTTRIADIDKRSKHPYVEVRKIDREWVISRITI